MSGKKRASRVDIQASILTAVMVVVSCISIFLLNYTWSYNDMIDSLQERSHGIYSYLEEHLDDQAFSQLNTASDMQGEEYAKLKRMLENIKSAAGVRYLYTAKQAADGEYIYLVDGLPSDSEDFRNVGDPIEPEIVPELEQAYQNKIILPEQIKSTSWGNIFISYYPIHSSLQEGKVVGVVGIEFDAEHQYNTYRNLKIATPLVIVLCCAVSGVIAFFLFRRISNPAYRDLANTDMLTGLLNRNSFDIALHNLEASPDKKQVGFIVMDLDHLKQINDTKGHAVGDEYIRAGSHIMQQAISPPDVLYRTGGDEFVAILRGKGVKQAMALAHAIEKSAGTHQTAYDAPIRMSFGCAVFSPMVDASLQDTLKRADAAMYEMKEAKKLRNE